MVSDQTPDQDDPRDDAATPPDRVVPGQPPAAPVPPVPAPGDTAPGVRAAQGASPEDGVHRGEKDDESDASVSSPGAWTAIAAPGKPDGEVDTR